MQLDETNPIAAYKDMASAPIASTKYVQLPAADRETSPVHVSKSVYCALMQLTLDFGGLKDAGEPIHFIREAYVRAGLGDEKKAHDDVAKLFQGVASEHDILSRAHEHYEAMKRNGLVRALREAVSA